MKRSGDRDKDLADMRQKMHSYLCDMCLVRQVGVVDCLLYRVVLGYMSHAGAVAFEFLCLICGRGTLVGQGEALFPGIPKKTGRRALPCGL